MRTLKIISLFFLLVGLMGKGYAQQAGELNQYRKLAWSNVDQANYNEAIRYADLALALIEDDMSAEYVEMTYVKAKSIFKKINWPNRRKYNGEYNSEFRQIINLLVVCDGSRYIKYYSQDPRYKDAFFMYGYAHYMIGGLSMNFRRASNCFELYNQAVPTDPYGYFNRGLSEMSNVRQNILEGSNANPEGYKWQYGKALECFKKARELGLSAEDDKEALDLMEECSRNM